MKRMRRQQFSQFERSDNLACLSALLVTPDLTSVRDLAELDHSIVRDELQKLHAVPSQLQVAALTDVVREEVRQLVRPLVPPPTEAPLLTSPGQVEGYQLAPQVQVGELHLPRPIYEKFRTSITVDRRDSPSWCVSGIRRNRPRFAALGYCQGGTGADSELGIDVARIRRKLHLIQAIEDFGVDEEKLCDGWEGVPARRKEAEELEHLALERATTRQKEAAAYEREREHLRLELRSFLVKRAGGQATVKEKIQERSGTINLEGAAELAGECGVCCQSEMTSIPSMRDSQDDSVVKEGVSRLGIDAVSLTEQEECTDALVKPESIEPEVLMSTDIDVDGLDSQTVTVILVAYIVKAEII
ncbi:hypothetical protein HPB51_019376 [Rhipicephalus microplus]|uniref:Uncharacterized protein n=1 Tax=Rhipicephalus microplus TaxID=6941 RepID=A0A9J6DBM0_RHIMP|nr:hypothetical protein HPB51_019376 [Rhipicephalus microplus]